jgi:tail lysozyme
MTYLPKAQRFTRDGMVSYILSIPKTGFKVSPAYGIMWNPKGVTIHNTASPDLVQWSKYSEAQKESWGDNLNEYYRKMGWHSGPHFAATPEPWSYVLCDPQADGVHDSCVNIDHFGVETVGNFEVGGDDPNSQAGVAALASAINIMAALSIRFGFDPDATDFHRRCKRDGHPCPGSRVTDQFIISGVKARIAEINKQSTLVNLGPLTQSQYPQAPTPMPPTIILPTWPPDTDPFFQHAARVFNKWKSYGLSNEFALAMTAQAEAESAFLVNAKGDHDTAYGIYQLHVDRCTVVKAATGIDVTVFPALEKQCDAAWWELNNTEKVALNNIRGATNARDAGIAACVYYERAGAPAAAERRGAMSERWAVYFTNNPKVLADNPAQ